MKFKNQFEKSIYEIARDVFGSENTQIDHNKVIQIEDKTAKSAISFAGPPKKEVDVLSVTISNQLKIQLLVSCKDFGKSKAEPAHVQEWCAVVNTMNKHSVDSKYIGIVISSSGFSSGCEGWATSENVGLIPPLKGINMSYSQEQVLSMFKRTCIAISRRLKFPFGDILEAPNFYDFCYTITNDYEGFVGSDTSSRYKHISKGWKSNFSELVNSIVGKRITNLSYGEARFQILLEDGISLMFSGGEIEFGESTDGLPELSEIPNCTKNLENHSISFNDVTKLVVGSTISSAADFQDYIELGINGKLNLALIPPNRIHLMIFNEIG